MIRNEHLNGVITYSFRSLTDLPVRAYVSTRHGGVSPAPWDSLNFSVARGDAPERVQENRLRFAAAVGVDAETIVRCRQVHGTGVAKVDWNDAGTLQDGVDALMTDAIRLPLALVFADCVPILLYDRAHHALGICHAGWRGTINGAGTALLWAMQAAYGCDPADVIVCIGPSIGPQSYEVGDDVTALAHARLEGAERYFRYPNGEEGRAYFDLWSANIGQFETAGAPSGQIECSGIDTAQHTHEFFSHRAESGRCGLFTMMAWLEEDVS